MFSKCHQYLVNVTDIRDWIYENRSYGHMQYTDLKYWMHCSSLMVQYSPTKLTRQEA